MRITDWAAPAALAALFLAGTAGAAAPTLPLAKPFTLSGLTGMWTVDQKEYDHPDTPPYTAEGLALSRKAEAQVNNGKVIPDDGLQCLPMGMPSMMMSEFAVEILETPGRITLISEGNSVVRSVYLNRTMPTEGLEPMWNGYSMGHWEGGTLIVKTTNFNERRSPLVYGGGIHSATTTLTERFTLSPDGKAMVDAMTFEDPRYLSRPYTVSRHFTRLPDDAELWEYACEVGGEGWSQRFKGDTDAAKENPGL